MAVRTCRRAAFDDGDGNIVDHAESLAMVGNAWWTAPPNVNGDAIGQGLAGADRIDPPAASQNARTSSGEKRNFELHLFLRAERAGLHL